MAKRFLSGIDLERNQILNIALHNLAAPPASPVLGQVYYNTVSKIVFYWDGVQWVGIAGSITEVAAGTGMTGGGTTGTVTLNFNPDNVTIEVAPDNTVRIKDLGVTTGKIGNLAVTTGKIADTAVTEAKIADSAVTTNKINNLAVTEGKLANNAVTTVKITDKNVTFAKIQDIATMTVIGRVAAGTGTPSAVTILSDLSMASGTTLATSQAIKSYVDATLTSLGNLEGGFNAATATDFPIGQTPTPGTKKGDYWYVTVAGTVHGVVFDVGDVLIATKDNAAVADASDWIVLETNRGQATTTILGVVALATQAEVIAGTNNTKAVTPASIPDATASQRGFTTLASNAETQAGTVSTKAVTPASLASRTATESRTGLAAIATQAQVTTGTNDLTIVTPLKLKTFFDNAVGGFAANVGNGSATSFVLSHGLGTEDVQVQIKDNTTKELVETDVVVTNAANVTVSFNAAPPTGRYRVIIKK
jgi:hypothetical protein